MSRIHLKDIKKNKVFLCLVVFLAMTVLPGCKNYLASTSGQSLPDMPMKAPRENSLEYEMSQKPVIESKLLSDMESLKNWAHRGLGTISLANDKFYKGRASILLTSPTKGDKTTQGRPWGSASAVYKVENEDWNEWNRITLWVYPDLPGFRTVSLSFVFHNDNRLNTTVDIEDYDAYVDYDLGGYPYYMVHHGLNYQLLVNHQWNKVYWEIPHLERDKVIAIELRYRTQGNQPEGTNTAKYYFDEMYLEKVKPEHYEGWNVAPGQIAYNNLGYSTGFPKTALSSDLSANSFTLVDVNTNKEALQKPITLKKTQQGTFQVLDFSEIDKSGTYILKAGAVQTKPFQINNFENLYRGNIIKLINFYYTMRCGAEIPGLHSVCHSDWICAHGDKSIVINGGWHDAGDLSQGVARTADAVYAMILLAEKFQDTDPELSERLLEEAKWGLDYILKTRFGDGYRATWAVMDMWTDGIFGTVDDVVNTARNDAYANFLAARAEAKATISLLKKDTIMANYALRCAKEDWNFAAENDNNMNIRVAGAALNASLTLYEATKDDKYKNAAISYGDYIVQCQQQDNLSSDISLKGFFYQDAKRENILSSPSISCDEAYPVAGLVGLLQSFPDNTNVKKWDSAIRLYASYYKDISAYTDPYFMLPAGIYDLNKAQNEIEQEKVKNGVQLNERYYFKCFPAWDVGRGNNGIILSKAKGLAAIARYLNDLDLLDLSYRQFDWILGLNPFNQSLMWGEGYRYPALYSPFNGNIVGALPVGIETHFNRDVPYWSPENTHNFKETWVYVTGFYLWLLDDFLY